MFKINKKLQGKTRKEIWSFLEPDFKNRKNVMSVFVHLMHNNDNTNVKLFAEHEDLRGNQILISIFALGFYDNGLPETTKGLYTIQGYVPHHEPEFADEDRYVVLDPEGFIYIPEHFTKEEAERECEQLNNQSLDSEDQ